MPKIIVSYRRSDSSASAGRVYDHLLSHFGEGSVFMDVDAIPFGTDFRTHIRSELLLSDILLAVIGPRWLGPGPDGRNRIDDEADPVRVEVETALRHGLTIVPVLIDGAGMPGAGQLPEPIRALAFLNAAPVDMGRDFRAHMDRLSRSLAHILTQRREGEQAAASTPDPVTEPSRPAGRPSSPERPPNPPLQSPAGRARPWPMIGAAAALLLTVGAGTVGWRIWDKRAEAAPAAPATSVAATTARAPDSAPVAPARVETVARTEAPPRVETPAPAGTPAPVETPARAETPPPAERVAKVSPPQPEAQRPKSAGSFAWYELWTTNASAAQTFYRSVIGWDARTAGQGDAAYTTLLAGGQVPVAGLATLPAATVAQGARPNWVGYVTVDDVDSSTAQVRQLGGTVYRAPADIPGVGRYALVADPQGAMIVLFKGSVEMPAGPATTRAVGYAGWRELQATDRDAAFDFYAKLFGWARTEASDVTSAGYQLFSAGAGPIGGIRSKPANMPLPFWTYYFQVDSVSAAASRAQAAGGTIINPPQQVQGGIWIVQGVDPQGATFALMSPQR